MLMEGFTLLVDQCCNIIEIDGPGGRVIIASDGAYRVDSP